MSEKDVQISYNTSLQPLAELLEGIARPGDYFSAGTWEMPLPRLEVKELSVLSFPLPPMQGLDLAELAEPAPYGRGDETLHDESVRKVRQLAPEMFTLGGKAWEKAFPQLVEHVAKELGADPATTEAELYKLLIYREGDFFAAHRDTEKTRGMFGTLVVALPSVHKGGDLTIRHSGRETSVSLANDDPGQVRYAAFYADCEHEVRRITRGYRLCLVYNLVAKGKKASPKTPDDRPAVEKAAEILKPWAKSAEDPLKLVYLLEHHYTEAALSFAELKNVDAAQAAVLRKAAKAAGCALHLGIVHIEESGWAEYNGDFHEWGSRRWDEEFEQAQSDFEVGEVCDGSYYIDQWRSSDDESVDFGRIPLGEDEILPKDALDGEPPDDAHFSEATGNEGASFERTYLRAALVLWPEQRFDKVCITGGLDAAIARFGQIIDEAVAAKNTPQEMAARDHFLRFAKIFPTDWPKWDDSGKRLTQLLRHLSRFGSRSLLLYFQDTPIFQHYDGTQNVALMACLKRLAPGERLEFLGKFAYENAASFPAGCMDLWRRWAKQFPEEKDNLEEVLLFLSEGLRRCTRLQDQQKFQGYSPHVLDQLIAQEKPAAEPEPLAQFLTAVHSTLGKDQADHVLHAIQRNLKVFAPETLLLPCLEHLDSGAEKSNEALRLPLWQICAEYYLARSATPPQEPKDWAMDVTIEGSKSNALLRELQEFARDPQAREHRFRVRKDLRQKLHRAIERARLDMTHVTERRGSPQTLVCTKTRATYKRACNQYQSDLTDMRRLLALPIAGHPSLAQLRQQTEKALQGQ